jgi:hypothetical protein
MTAIGLFDERQPVTLQPWVEASASRRRRGTVQILIVVPEYAHHMGQDTPLSNRNVGYALIMSTPREPDNKSGIDDHRLPGSSP